MVVEVGFENSLEDLTNKRMSANRVAINTLIDRSSVRIDRTIFIRE